MLAPDGRRIMHAALRIGKSFFFLVDDFPEFCGGMSSTATALKGTPVTIHHYVENCDAAIKRAQDAGASVFMPAADMFWGDRYGAVTDPFGHKWSFGTRLKDMTPAEMQAAMKGAFVQHPDQQAEMDYYKLDPPRFENGKEMLIAGVSATFTFETRKNIPKQWGQFAPRIGKVPGQVGKASYGVCWNYKPGVGFDYLSGVEVSGTSGLPADFSHVTIPAAALCGFHSSPECFGPAQHDRRHLEEMAAKLRLRGDG